MSQAEHSLTAVARLVVIMARLRDPDRGCEWDRAQTWATIAPYTIEEAYEVADAIAREDVSDLKDELGDLLLTLTAAARARGWDAERALRERLRTLEAEIRDAEA